MHHWALSAVLSLPLRVIAFIHLSLSHFIDVIRWWLPHVHNSSSFFRSFVFSSGRFIVDIVPRVLDSYHPLLQF